MNTLLLLILLAAAPAAAQPETEPGIEQPVPFSHRIHARQARLACALCHAQSGVAGRHMSIAPATMCMGCHRTIAAGRPGVRKLANAVRRRQAVKWEPVWFLPDFVWFSHRRHAKTAGCDVCHGRVEQRDVLWREVEITMKFCRNCHQKTGAKAECGTCHPVK